MKRATRASGAIVAVCLLAATACSSDGDETTSESASTAAPATTEPETEEPAVTASSDDGGASVSVVLTDPFSPAGTPDQFTVEPDPISVDAGSLEIVAMNQGGDVHNLVIVKPGTADTVAAAAIALGAEGFAREFIPESADILHHTALLNGGESQTLEFTAPSDPGDYQFVCTFPGHAMLMRGIIRVK